MTDTSKIFAALIASLIVVSSLGGVAITPAEAQTSGTDGMLALGDAQVSEDVPADADMPIRASDLEGAVYASDHASTLEVVLTTPERAEEYMGENASVLADDEIAIVLRDDEVSEGRDVAIDLEVLEEGVGFVPEVAYGTHEDGERWESAIEPDGTVGRFHVPHFSENAVTFTGGVSITASPATDGSEFSYELTDLDSASNVTVNLTGETSGENESASGTLQMGETTTVDVAGNAPPKGQSEEIPQISVTGKTVTEQAFYVEYTDTPTSGSETFQPSDINIDDPKRITGIYDTNFDYGSESTLTITGYIDGTEIGSTSATVEYEKAVGYSFEIPKDLRPFDEASVSWSLSSEKSGSSDFSGNVESTGPRNVSILVNGEEKASLGSFEDGETKTADLPLTTGTNELEINGSGGEAAYSLAYQEQSETQNPAVELNGETASYSGTLADGETTSLSIPPSALQEGTNRVNVSVGDGSLSSDAPAAAVGLELSHEASDEQTVDYSAETWSERYNVSRTYGDATENPTLTIPFEAEVVDINSVDVRRNGSSWGPPAAWTLDNTTLTVEFDPIDSGETVEVRAIGRKVVTRNGDIQVLEPTVEGDTLDSKIEITDRSEDFAIDVSGSDRIHYTTKESWSASSYVVVESGGGQELRLPEASVGSQTRVRTAPLNAVPESGASEVVIEDADEPRFRIREGNTTGASTIEITYYDTLSGERYVLWSETQEREIDADRAESPVTFITDGSADTYTIRQMAAPGSTGGVPPPDTRNVGAPLVLVVPAVGVSVAGLFWAGRRFGGARGVRGNALLLVGSTVVAIAAVELVAPGTISSIIKSLIFAVGDSVASGIGAAVAATGVLVGLWQLQKRTERNIPWWVTVPSVSIAAIAALEAIRPGSVLGALEVVLAEYGGLVVLAAIGLLGYYLYQRRKEATTPDTQVTLDLGNSED